jgi:hypothetical protein
MSNLRARKKRVVSALCRAERARGALRWWAHCEERTRTASAKHRACGGVVGYR